MSWAPLRISTSLATSERRRPIKWDSTSGSSFDRHLSHHLHGNRLCRRRRGSCSLSRRCGRSLPDKWLDGRNARHARVVRAVKWLTSRHKLVSGVAWSQLQTAQIRQSTMATFTQRHLFVGSTIIYNYT